MQYKPIHDIPVLAAARLLASIGILVIALPLCSCRGKADAGVTAKPAQVIPPVRVAEAVRKSMPVELRTFGTVESLATVTVKSQITGVLTNIAFTEGQDVRCGDLLFQIDSLLLENALRQTTAVLAKDRIQHKNAEREAQRQKELLAGGLSSQDTYDQAQTQADALAATVQADEAACENVRIQLDYCRIRSPIDGRTGNQLVDKGNLIKANDTTLLTINQVKPIHVSFAVPQQDLPTTVRQMREKTLTVYAILPDEPEKQEQGQLTFLDNAVDSSTGTIALKATFPNTNERLWPGQFVRIVLVLSIHSDALVVPARAIMTGQQGAYVFVLTSTMTVEQRPVQVARTLNSEAVIAAGLTIGDRVVTEGQQRLGPGIKVKLATTESKPAAPAP